MSDIVWQIPPSVLERLAALPRDRPVALLLRHSVRDSLPEGEAGYALPITAEGRRIARELGGLLGGRLKALHTSPLVRCVQTAEMLREGASVARGITPDRLLGDPGIFVVDNRVGGAQWRTLGHESVMAHLVSSPEPLPGLARPDPAARFLVQHMLAVAGDEPGVHIFVTHDSLITTTAAWMLRTPLGTDAWPWFLEGAFFWRGQGGVQTAYRALRGCQHGDRLCELTEEEVIEFGRREVARTLGCDIDARFFLAGGAFKTLLTGRPAADLDLWAPSERDRQLLLGRLTERGARRLPPRTFADGFEIAGRTVELPRKVEPDTLAARLARFDVALSAVGVEHRPGGVWSALIDPRAVASVERREVLLLRPLVNWKYALATLERARRYADELGFVVPAEEEAAVWTVFDQQSQTEQAAMIDRCRKTARGGYGVLEEAACRCR